MSDERLEAIVGPVLAAAIADLVAEEVAAALAAERSRSGRRRFGFVTVAEASDATGLTERAIRAHASRGRIPSKRLGSRLLVDLSALED